ESGGVAIYTAFTSASLINASASVYHLGTPCLWAYLSATAALRAITATNCACGTLLIAGAPAFLSVTLPQPIIPHLISFICQFVIVLIDPPKTELFFTLNHRCFTCPIQSLLI